MHVKQQQLPQFLYHANIAALLLTSVVPILLFQNLLPKHLFVASHVNVANKALLPVADTQLMSHHIQTDPFFKLKVL